MSRHVMSAAPIAGTHARRHSPGSFRCRRCRLDVSVAPSGTQHRNHCPNCLWSLHVDDDVPGDRAADCAGSMEPIGVSVGDDGEWALVHRCTACSTVPVNRIAGDDNPLMLMRLAVHRLARPPSRWSGSPGYERHFHRPDRRPVIRRPRESGRGGRSNHAASRRHQSHAGRRSRLARVGQPTRSCVATLSGAVNAGREHLVASRDLHRELGVRIGEGRALSVLGMPHVVTGEVDRAK